MPGVKRDWHGAVRKPQQNREAARPVVRNAYTSMFEGFRDELDKHHDRKERIVKASRDITALSKKIIFSHQRVQKIEPELPQNITAEGHARMKEISVLLAGIASDVQGINRWRYMRNMMGIEELVEAMTFGHYLRHQSLFLFEETAQTLRQMCHVGATAPDPDSELDTPTLVDPPSILLTPEDYLMGVFDLSGEMMRFATTTAALNGELASGSSSQAGGRTIVADMQELGSFFEMLPQQGHDKSWRVKMETLRASVHKVEKIGYGLAVRGGERPKGWMPEDGHDSRPGSPV